ncbi:hypothetical protein QOT17_018985 [Balamuthia mandrillaris]
MVCVQASMEETSKEARFLPVRQKMKPTKQKSLKQELSAITDARNGTPTDHLRCAETLQKIVGNILAHPFDPKYRTIRTSAAPFQKHVAPFPSALNFLRSVGFVTRVVEFREVITIEGADDIASIQQKLEEAQRVLAEMIASFHERDERHKKEEERRKNEDEVERQRILQIIEDNKQRRKG